MFDVNLQTSTMLLPMSANSRGNNQITQKAGKLP